VAVNLMSDAADTIMADALQSTDEQVRAVAHQIERQWAGKPLPRYVPPAQVFAV
jgi:hypothetical protein